MDKKDLKIINDVTKELLDLLGLDGEFKVLEKEDDKSVDIVLETKDTGAVIGYHGDTLEGMQLVLSLCVAKRLGRFVRVFLEVGDYRKNREDWLKNLAYETKEMVISQNKEMVLPELKSWERRIIHLLLEKDNEVMSESQGEGRDRVLVIKPKAS